MNCQFSLGILFQLLSNHSTELPRLRPDFAFRQANAVIGYDDATPRISYETRYCNSATLAADEGMLECVGHTLVDNEARRHGNIDGHRPSVHLELEAYALHRMRLHDRRCDLAQIYAKV